MGLGSWASGGAFFWPKGVAQRVEIFFSQSDCNFAVGAWASSGHNVASPVLATQVLQQKEQRNIDRFTFFLHCACTGCLFDRNTVLGRWIMSSITLASSSKIYIWLLRLLVCPPLVNFAA